MADVAALATYAQEVRSQFNSGHAREHAYRPALQRLFRSFDDVEAVNDPKRSTGGNPDFVFLRDSNRDIVLGYAEAKDVGVDLDKVEATDQMRRYAGYDNLILTDYLEFRFYRNGTKYRTIRIGEATQSSLKFDVSSYETLSREIADFLTLPPQEIFRGVDLAHIMGAKARRIRDDIIDFFNNGPGDNTSLVKIFQLVRSVLVHDLDFDRFADMYSQTLVYGLFVARFSDDTLEDFDRHEARLLIPKSNPFLRQFFDHIAGPDFDERLRIAVDELCDVFAVSDVKKIVSSHLSSTVGDSRDPIIHFYEDFLQSYDPVVRRRMGAYYTPRPVAKYIVRGVDRILREEFGLAKGLADTSTIKVQHETGQVHKVRSAATGRRTIKTTKQEITYHRVQVLDPSVGTATFLNEVILNLHQKFKKQQGRWPDYVNEDLLPRLHGFELMMAPYTIAHLKLAMTLNQTGAADLSRRLGVYLTNTLEEGIPEQPDLFTFGLAEAVTEESWEAGRIKTERPIMVVLGNPPYSGISSNETGFANALVQQYKYEPGGKTKLQERKHWLNDDYVKFIAFAEGLIRKNGEGIVALITNHGYVNNPTFRGMRWHLAETFDKLYILDLHGNVLRKEVAPDGTKDENVFDIQQGVAIIFGVRKKRLKGHKPSAATVLHSDLYGTRKSKFDALDSDLIEWQEVALDSKMMYFEPTPSEGKDEYLEGVALDDLFLKNVTGIVTARDGVVIDRDEAVLVDRMKRFSDVETSDDEIRSWLFSARRPGKYLPGDSRGWKLAEARISIRHNDHSALVRKVTYRPFDERYIYYVPEMVDWGRFAYTRQFGVAGLPSIISVRRVPDKQDHPYVFVSDQLVVNGTIRSDSVSIDSMFPLWRKLEGGELVPNLSPTAVKKLARNLTVVPTPEDVFHYTYGVLHSPNYRARFLDYLKQDFPRVPIALDDTSFGELAKLGQRLVAIHLMRHSSISDYQTSFPVSGDNIVARPKYDDGKIWLNAEQYFGDVDSVVWDVWIGGYQPARKWLKDRSGEALSSADLDHYQMILECLKLTHQTMCEIDEVFAF